MRWQIPTFVFLFALAPTRLTALIFGPDDRIVVGSQAGSIYGPVGMIFGASVRGNATAFLVDNCHVLTVRHAFDPDLPVSGTRATFAAGVAGNAGKWDVTQAQVVDAGYSVTPKAGANFDHDWALLKLKKCLGKKFGTAMLSRHIPTAGQRVQLAGYPNDKSWTVGLILDPDCRIREIRDGMVQHDCATQPGNSGSPLFEVVEVDGRTRMRVIAMNNAGHSFGVPGANLQLPVTSYHPVYAGSALTVQHMAMSKWKGTYIEPN